MVNVKNVGDEFMVTVQRNHVAQARDFVRVKQAPLLEIGHPAKGRRAIVVSDVNAQYKCIGAW